MVDTRDLKSLARYWASWFESRWRHQPARCGASVGRPTCFALWRFGWQANLFRAVALRLAGKPARCGASVGRPTCFAQVASRPVHRSQEAKGGSPSAGGRRMIFGAPPAASDGKPLDLSALAGLVPAFACELRTGRHGKPRLCATLCDFLGEMLE